MATKEVPMQGAFFVNPETGDITQCAVPLEPDGRPDPSSLVPPENPRRITLRPRVVRHVPQATPGG